MTFDLTRFANDLLSGPQIAPFAPTISDINRRLAVRDSKEAVRRDPRMSLSEEYEMDDDREEQE